MAYTSPKDKTFDELENLLYNVYERYDEYEDFADMVDLFAENDFYKLHYVAENINECGVMIYNGYS